MSELQVMARMVNDATSYVDVFDQIQSGETPADRVKRTYRRIARILHPDRYSDPSDKRLAEEAFRRFGVLKNAADAAVRAGTYGRPMALATITTRKATHTITGSAEYGDICATYRSESAFATGSRQTFIKVARQSRDNDLVQREAVVLKLLRSSDADPAGYAFIPELLDSFVYSEAGTSCRSANALAIVEGAITLEELRNRFSGALDPLHMVWIWRRLLVAIDHAHMNGVVHGAVVPEHVLVVPEQHGVVLIDWCYAALSDTKPVAAWQPCLAPLSAIVGSKRAWYPPEVLEKRSPWRATDIMLAARCMVWLVGGDPVTMTMPTTVPLPLRAFLRGCIAADPKTRPQDAYDLLREFDELLETIGAPYYPRRFRPLVVPHRATR